MKRLLLLLSAVFFLAPLAAAQNLTTVTATIADPINVPYSFAQVSAQLIPTGVTPTINGIGVAGFTRATADVNGTFSMNLASNAVLSPGGTQWQFTVTEPGIAPPLGTGPQSFVSVLVISGASMNITSTLNAAAPKLYNGGTNPISGNSYPVGWVDITMPPYNAKGDGRSVTCGTSNGFPQVTSAGLFLASDQGKEIYIYNANNGNAFTIGTVQTFTDTSDIVLSGNAITSSGTEQCHIGTNNYPAIHAAELALTAGQTLYYPGGIYLIDDHSIFNSGALATSAPITVMGGGYTATQIWFPPFGTTATTSQVINSSLNSNAHIHDFWIRPGPEVATSTSNQNFVHSFASRLVERVAADNFLATSVPTACWSSSGDGTLAVSISSTGCAIGLYDQWKTQTIYNGVFNGTINGAKLFDFGGQIVGGTYSGGGNNAGILNVVQGTPEAWQIMGATIIGSGTGCAYSGGANTSAVLIGNNLGNRLGANDSGVCTTAASARVYTSHNSMFSHGTGFAYNNVGQLYKDGTDQMVQVGAGIYTGAGSVNGKTTLTGAAYTNSTTGFTAVTGGAGEAFLWNVDASDQLNVTCHLYYQAAATGGLNIEFTGPASPTAVRYGLLLPVTTGTAPISSEAAAYSTSLGAVVGTAATDFDAIVSFSLVNGATAGNVTLLAKSSAAVALTIQPGSYCQSQ